MLTEDSMNPNPKDKADVTIYIILLISGIIFTRFMGIMSQNLVKSILKVNLYEFNDQKFFNYILTSKVGRGRSSYTEGVLNFGKYEFMTLLLTCGSLAGIFKRKYGDWDAAIKYGYIINLLSMLCIDFIVFNYIFNIINMKILDRKPLSLLDTGKEKIMEFLILYEDLYNNDLESYLNRAMNSIYFSRVFIIFLLSILFFIIPLKIAQCKEQENQE